MQAVLWDLDGTLVDSAEYHYRAWAATVAPHGIALTREQFEATFGQKNDTILALWLGHVDPAEASRLGDAKEVAYRRFLREGGLAPLPGAEHWIRDRRAAGWKQAIASSAPRLNVEAVASLLGWESAFDAFVAAEDVTAGKPAPDVFLVGATRLGVPPHRCIVVEDAAAGVEAAHRAGMRCIGVGPRATGADLAVPTLAALGPDAFDVLLARQA